MTDRTPTPSGDPQGAAVVVDDYFDRLTAAATRVGTPIAPDDLAELRAHVAARLDATAHTAADATTALDELGTPEALAQAFADAAADDPEARGHLAGRVLGMPYDVRPLTSERVARRAWDPTSRKILVPKAFGIGWTVNFGALAVRTHLVRPDDEDDPFTSAGPRVVTATLAAPVAAVVALGVLVAATWSTLPGTVPTHWGLDGQPDGFGTPTVCRGLPGCARHRPDGARRDRAPARPAAVRPRRRVRREPRLRGAVPGDLRPDTVHRPRRLRRLADLGSASPPSWCCPSACSWRCPGAAGRPSNDATSPSSKGTAR